MKSLSFVCIETLNQLIPGTFCVYAQESGQDSSSHDVPIDQQQEFVKISPLYIINITFLSNKEHLLELLYDLVMS